MRDRSLRIGVSLRTEWFPRYRELRDCLAHDFYAFLQALAPDAVPVLLPNVGTGVRETLERLSVDCVVLTGGNSIGESPIRDETELAILRRAEEIDLPVFGVCRGAQVIQHHLGGPILTCSADEHVATRHEIRLLADPFGIADSGDALLVNSFHDHGIPSDGLAKGLEAFAVSRDGLAEGIRHLEKPFCGVMWHPERNQPYAEFDLRLMRRALALESTL